MTSTLPSPEPSITEERLLDYGGRYNFFVLVSMLERLTPVAVRVGGEGPYVDERIRFRHDHDLVFNAGEVRSIKRARIPRPSEEGLDPQKFRYEITTSFMGVTGSMTPMPLYIAEEICQQDDEAELKRDFLDLFHHRLISLVYRIGVKFEFAREHTQDADDPWSRRMLAMAGIDAYSGWHLRHLTRRQLLRLAPLLSSRVRSARTLALAIAEITSDARGDASVDVIQFAGGWTRLDLEQRMLVGQSNAELGINSVLGTQCYFRGGKATIVVGPLGDNFRRFLSDGDMLPAICEIVGLLSPEPINYELELVLADRPPFLLGHKQGGRVGFDAWLSSESAPTSATHLKVPLPMDLLNVSPEEVGVGSMAPSLSKFTVS